jgi:hypothetical protein
MALNYSRHAPQTHKYTDFKRHNSKLKTGRWKDREMTQRLQIDTEKSMGIREWKPASGFIYDMIYDMILNYMIYTI